MVNTASPAGTVTKRTVVAPNGSGLGYLNGLLADGQGTLYVSFQAFGGSGYSGWYAIAAASTTITLFEPRTAFQYAAVNSTHLTQLQSAEWCPSASEGSPKGCHVDQTLTHLVARDAAGTLSEHTMSGPTANGRGAFVGAADEDGDVFVVIDGGPTPGLAGGRRRRCRRAALVGAVLAAPGVLSRGTSGAGRDATARPAPPSCGHPGARPPAHLVPRGGLEAEAGPGLGVVDHVRGRPLVAQLGEFAQHR